MKRATLVLLVAAFAAGGALPAQSPGRALVNGDRVLLKLWMDSIFVDSARVQDGHVILPRFGPLTISGVPATSLADSIRSAYSKVFQPVTVEVTPLRRVVILGEVRQPRVYFFEINTTFREAIAAAGGIPESGRTGRITLYRDSVHTRIRDWQERADDAMIVRSGDMLLVDRENWAKRNAFTVVSGISVLLSIVITLTR